MSASLLILAAGLGTRFKGGIKQLMPVGTSGEPLMEYSVYDALNAGFDKVIFVIRRDIEGQLREMIGDRLSKHISVEYCYQEAQLSEIPGFSEINRIKPWGTGHAVLSAKKAVGSDPFIIVNADDYYGTQCYKSIYNFLTSPERKHYEHCMSGFILKNTLSSSGAVTRGVCSVDSEGCLSSVTETYNVISDVNGGIRGERSGTPVNLPGDSIVSMNMWGFDSSVIGSLESLFRDFLNKAKAEGTLQTAEYILPNAADELIRTGQISVKVLPTDDKWFGMTYKEDFAGVSEEFEKISESGKYTSPLFS